MLFTALKNFAPRERPDPAKWFEENLFMPDGEPWSNDNYPHLAAPGGPIEAFLDPYIRRIWLQFASRLSKTAFGIACGCYQAAFDPCPMLFGTSTKTLASRIFKKKLYPILDRSPLREELPAPHRRNQTRVDLSACSWYAAWSGSSSELADLAARYLHGNEIDKWDATLSAEADPLDLFGERAKEFPNRKEIYESTPGMKVTSRIERGRLASDNRSLWVPCPHCGTFQILRTGDGGPGGVIFDKKRDGHTDIGLAQRTARYLCEKCEGEIWDHQRAAMMRGGRWAKAGQKIIDGKCVGEPHYVGDNAGFQLSSLYALSLTWGDYAAKFVESKKKKRKLQNFVNSWEGKTWEPRKTKSRAEQIAERLCVPEQRRGIVPHGGRFIVVGVDKQGETGDFFPFTVWAFGLEERSWLVHWGEAFTLDELWNNVLSVKYEHEDGGPPMPVQIVMMDSGWKQSEVYEFCRQHLRFVFPVKGSGHAMEEPYRIAFVDDGKSLKRQSRGLAATDELKLVTVNTRYWEDDLQPTLDDLTPGEPGSISLPKEAAADSDLIEQLYNATQQVREDSAGNTTVIWMKSDENQPNDYRDCTRYARCGAMAFLAGRQQRMPERRLPTGERRDAPKSFTPPPAMMRDDGRDWFPDA